jgi:hypothetical protein
VGVALIEDEAERGGMMAREEGPFCGMGRGGIKGAIGGVGDSLLEFDVERRGATGGTKDVDRGIIRGEGRDSSEVK